MSFTTKRFFVFLVLFILLSTALGYRGIERLRRTQNPPFTQGLHEILSSIPHPSDGAILFLDSTLGRISVWTSAIAIPALCGILSFRQERWMLGCSILFSSSGVFGWIGISLWLHAMFDTIPL